jgi:hypothetical protein
MAYPNETPIFKLPYPSSGGVSSAQSQQDGAFGVEDPLALALTALAGASLNCTVLAGFLVSAGGGLSVNIAAGQGLVGGLVISAAGITNLAGLPNNTALIYIYLQTKVTTKRDNSFTAVASLSGPPQANSILIATVTTSGGAVTVVNNSPAGRAAVIPASTPGIPTLRVVGTAGATYSDPKAAIEACNAGDIVLITAGTYALTATITVPANNITILGASRDATVLNNTTGSTQGVLNLNGKSGTRIAHLTIATAAGNVNYGVYSASAADGIVIEDLYFDTPALYRAISLYGSARCRIVDCRVSASPAYTTSYIIHLDTCTDSVVERCTILHGGGNRAISLLTCLRCRVVDNHVTIGSTNIDQAMLILDSSYVLCSGNVVYVTSPGAKIYIAAMANAVSCTNVTITGNIVISSGVTGIGIELLTTNPYNLDDCIVSNNSLILLASGVIVADARTRYSLIHGNMAKGCTAAVTDSGTSSTLADNVGP